MSHAPPPFRSVDRQPRAFKTHQEAPTSGQTCVDCRHGIAHTRPQHAIEAYQNMAESLATGDAKILTDDIQSVSKAAKTRPK